MEAISGSTKSTDILSVLFSQLEQTNDSNKSEFNELFEKEYKKIIKNDSPNPDMKTHDSMQLDILSSNVSNQTIDNKNTNEVEIHLESIGSETLEQLTEENHKATIEIEKENKQTQTIPVLESFLLASMKIIDDESKTEEGKIDKQKIQWNGIVDLTSPNILPNTEVEQGELFVNTKEKNKTDEEVNDQDVQLKESKAMKTDVQNVSAEQDMKVREVANTTNRNTISTMVKKEIMQHIGSVVKVAQPDKIVVQLKPMELGAIEITVEKIDGEIVINMKSENKDVQELLDNLVEEMQEEMKNHQVADTGDTSNEEREKKEKTKEEFVVPKKEYEEKADLSFEEMLTNWMEGNINGRNNGYHQ